MSAIPEKLVNGGTRMSNCDHSIDDGTEEFLREGAAWIGHAAWNFYGHVWWDGEQFCEEVWCYGSPRSVFRAATLRELMREVNAEYGNA